MFGRVWDRRTTAHRRFMSGVYGAAGTALGTAGTLLAPHLFGNRTSVATPPMPSYRIQRRAFRRRMFRRVRRSIRRYAPRVIGRTRGRRYTTSKRFRRQPRLNTNLTGNDYRKYRCQANLGVVRISGGSTTNTSRYELSLDSFTTYFAAFQDWKQFRLANVQFVLVPRTCITGNFGVQVVSNDLPYLAVREVTNSENPPSNINMDSLRQTPGYRYIPIQKKARSVFSVTPQIHVQDRIVIGEGVFDTVDRYKRMPWIDNTETTQKLPFAGIDITRPTLSTGFTQDLNYDVYVYATVLLRGSKFLAPEE